MMDAFVLQIHPKKEYRLYDALWHFPTGTHEIILGEGNKPKPRLLQGRSVYLWEAGGRDLVGRGTVLNEKKPLPMPDWQRAFSLSPQGPDPTTPRSVINVNLRLDPPLSRARIQQDPILADATFFRNRTNPTGTVFYVKGETAGALDRLIDTERRRAGGFAEEMPAQYLDAVGEADWDGLFDPNYAQDARKRQLREIAIRQGQPQFRRTLLRAYERRCAITSTDVADVLEAAHILPYLNEKRNHVSNGLLLRADVHTLFDLGLIAVGQDLEILMAASLRATRFGAELSTRRLRIPKDPSCQPNPEALKIHREQSRITGN